MQVVRVAIAHHTREQNRRDVERAQRERISPVLRIDQRLILQEQREHDIVYEHCYTCEDVERHYGGKRVSQRPQMHLRTDLAEISANLSRNDGLAALTCSDMGILPFPRFG